MALQRGLTAKTVNAALCSAAGAWKGSARVQHQVCGCSMRKERSICRERAPDIKKSRKKPHQMRKVGYKPMALRLLP